MIQMILQVTENTDPHQMILGDCEDLVTIPSVEMLKYKILV